MHAEHHVLPLKVYFAVFATLLLFTFLTVAVSTLGLPAPFALMVALVVASVKGLLVAFYFMHLRYDLKYYTFIFFSSLLIVLLFFVFVITEIGTRSLVNEENEPRLFEKYEQTEKN